MSKIALTGNALGTGTLTIAAPNTNTDRTLTLPDNSGTAVLNEGVGIFKIDSTGKVGIGTSTPNKTLHVAGDARIGNTVIDGFGAIEINNLGSGDRAATVDFHCSGAAGTLDYSARIIRDPGENGGIYLANVGTGNFNIAANNAIQMYIQGTTGRVILQNGGGSRGGAGTVLTTSNDTVADAVRAGGYIQWSTDIGAVGTTYFVSDERKKDNIAPSAQSSADLINQINFIQFDWKPESGNSGHVEVGVSAQQLQGIDTRLVHELSDGGLMVSEPALVAHIAKALQEALAKITALEARITALEQPT